MKSALLKTLSEGKLVAQEHKYLWTRKYTAFTGRFFDSLCHQFNGYPSGSKSDESKYLETSFWTGQSWFTVISSLWNYSLQNATKPSNFVICSFWIWFIVQILHIHANICFSFDLRFSSWCVRQELDLKRGFYAILAENRKNWHRMPTDRHLVATSDINLWCFRPTSHADPYPFSRFCWKLKSKNDIGSMPSELYPIELPY